MVAAIVIGPCAGCSIRRRSRARCVLGIAIAGLTINFACAWLLSRASGSLNARGAMIHVLGDLLGSLAAIISGGVIVATGWMPIDPILSIAVSLLILRSTLQLLKQSTGVLMEGVPTHLDYNAIGQALARLPGGDRRARPSRVEHDRRARRTVRAYRAGRRRRAEPQTLARLRRCWRATSRSST